MNFIFITYDAIVEFASDRFFQSAEYLESSMLCDVLQGASTYWEHNKIVFQITEKGCFFYTHKLDKKQGLMSHRLRRMQKKPGLGITLRLWLLW